MIHRFVRFVRRIGSPEGHGDLRLQLLRLIARMVLPRYRFHWHQLDWLLDRPFTDYLDRFEEVRGLNTHRRWMLAELIRLVTAVPGHTAECGVYAGASSFLICQFNKQNRAFDRTHFVFDSFEGLSRPTAADGQHWTAGDLACDLATVQQNLADCENITYHQGWIPAVFAAVADRSFAFVHIDVDLHEPTRDSLRFFYPRMSAGGIILCDDYGFTSCPGATAAIDEFLADKPEKMISLPSGGGFLIAGTKVGSPIRL